MIENPEVRLIASKAKYLKATVQFGYDVLAPNRYPERLTHEARSRLSRQMAEKIMQTMTVDVINDFTGQEHRVGAVMISYNELLELLNEAYLKGCHRIPTL